MTSRGPALLRSNLALLAAVAIAGLVLGASGGSAPPPRGPGGPGPASLPQDEGGVRWDICLECHDDLIDGLTEGKGHDPVVEGECVECHDPHASHEDHLVREKLPGLCEQCHDPVTEPTNGSDNSAENPSVHPPAAEGTCLECHDPHGTDHDSLLREIEPGLCRRCHAFAANRSDHGWSHGPFADGDCLECHTPHASVNPKLLQMPPGELCAECHEIDDPDFLERHNRRTPIQVSCLSCHAPHYADEEAPFQAFVHEPFADGECDLCHETEGLEKGALLADRPVDVCLECHDDLFGGSDIVSTHKPVQEGQCLSCHRPHSSPQPRLLVRPERDLCLGCHAKRRARAEAAVASHLLGNEKYRCTGCHAPHGGQKAKLFRKGIIETCRTCHEIHENFSHPVGEEFLDPRSGEPLTCLSCHDPHGTENAFFLRKDPRRELCVQCHEDFAG